MSKCIECKSPPIQLVPRQKLRHTQNGRSRRIIISLCGPFNKKSLRNLIIEDRTRYGITVISSPLIIPSFKVEAFPNHASSLCLPLAAVAKPADPIVLLQTSALLIFMYLMANFVVPQLLSKSLGFDREDENERPNSSSSTASQDEEKPNSTSNKRGFNSTKPK